MVGQPLLSPWSPGTLSSWGATAARRPCLSRWLIFPTTDRRWQGAWQCRPCGWSWHLMSEQNWAEPSGHKCQNSKTHFPRVALQIQLYSFLVHDCVHACQCTCVCKCACKHAWGQRTTLPDILRVLLALVFRQDCSLTWNMLSSLGIWPVSASPPLRLQACISTSSSFSHGPRESTHLHTGSQALYWPSNLPNPNKSFLAFLLYLRIRSKDT